MSLLKYKNNWKEAKENFDLWWNNEDIGRPIVKIIGTKGADIWPVNIPTDYKDVHINAKFRFELYTKIFSNKVFYGEAFPFMDINMGPGSMAAYLDAEPVFDDSTVWYKEKAFGQISELGKLQFDSDNFWWKYHKSQVAELVELAKNTDIMATIPDILENIDIISLLRSPQNLCYDLIDEPEIVEDYIKQIDDIYFKYYDEMYNLVKREDNSSSYTAFSILSIGTTAKVQCDFSALMSPTQFEQFIIPSLKKQCDRIDYTMYHLDGSDAVRHLDCIMTLENLNALQWTPGAGKPDGGDEGWYSIYDKVKDADKSLWISMDQGGVDRFIEMSKKIVKRYGTKGIYFVYPTLDDIEAQKLFSYAEKGFK